LLLRMDARCLMLKLNKTREFSKITSTESFQLVLPNGHP
jgi:hypothetical protein